MRKGQPVFYHHKGRPFRFRGGDGCCYYYPVSDSDSARMRILRSILLIGWFFLITGNSAICAQQEAWTHTNGEQAGTVGSAIRAGLSARRSGIWKDHIGNGFREGITQVGFSLGGGIGTKVFGSKHAHDLALASVHVGWLFSSHWELLGELWGGAQISPDKRQLFGITSLIRYNFATGSRWVPFVNIGTGFSYADIRGRDLSTDFQFNLQLGAGTHYFLHEDVAFTLQYRWLHLSNAGIKLPNNGVNTQMLFFGLSWF